MRFLHRCTSVVRPVSIWYWWKSCWIVMESPSATLCPCSSCRRIFQSRLFIVNPVAGSPRGGSALLPIVHSNVFNLVSMVLIWMWVLYCSRMLKCWSFDLLKVSEMSLLGEVNLAEFALSGSKWSASGEEVEGKEVSSGLRWRSKFLLESKVQVWQLYILSWWCSEKLFPSLVCSGFLCRRRLSGRSSMLPHKFKFFWSEGRGSRWCSRCGLRRVRWRNFR